MQLTPKDFYSIELYTKEGLDDAEIARRINRNKSVISRLFDRYPRESFDAECVMKDREERKSNASKRYARIKPGDTLEGYLIEKIKQGYSPEQVAGSWIRKQEENGITEKLSKDTVYAFVYEQAPGLTRLCLRRKGKKYRNRKQEKLTGKYQIQERRLIDDRPKEIEERKRMGDWEGDTIIGKDRTGAILTLVERKTGYLMAYKLERGKNAEGVTSAIRKLWSSTPHEKRKTLTFDNGREFADHKMLEYFTKTIVYFAHPYHSWERGTNENTNGLLREYIPKKTDFSTITQEQLDIFVERINSRPRKRLNYFTPSELFHAKSCVSV